MQLLDKPIYRVGEIEIDPARNCLRLHNEEWTLRQKSFQVLLYLLEHRERSVSKEELLKNIWDGAAVTDDTLVQIIVELRKTFGDDSRHPQFIRTSPKIGYHFIGPVSEPRSEPSQLIEIEEVTTVQVEYEQIEMEGQGDRRMGGLLRRVSASPRRRVVFASLGIGLLLALTANWLVQRRASERSTAAVTLPRVLGKKSVAVMYFENRANDRELEWLREGLGAAARASGCLRHPDPTPVGQ